MSPNDFSKICLLTTLGLAVALAWTPSAAAESLVPNFTTVQNHQIGHDNCADAGLTGEQDLWCVDLWKGTYCWFETPRGTQRTLEAILRFVSNPPPPPALPSAQPEPEPERKDPGCSFSTEIDGIGIGGGFDAFSGGHRDQVNTVYNVKVRYAR